MTAVAEETGVEWSAESRLHKAAPHWGTYRADIKAAVPGVVQWLIDLAISDPVQVRDWVDDELYRRFTARFSEYFGITFSQEVGEFRQATLDFLLAERDRLHRAYNRGEKVVMVDRGPSSRFQIGDTGTVTGASSGHGNRIRVTIDSTNEEVRVAPSRVMPLPSGWEPPPPPVEIVAKEFPPYLESVELWDPIDRLKAAGMEVNWDRASTRSSFYQVSRHTLAKSAYKAIRFGDEGFTNSLLVQYFIEVMRSSYRQTITVTDEQKPILAGLLRQAQAFVTTEWWHEQPGVVIHSDYLTAGRPVTVSSWKKDGTNGRAAYSNGADMGASHSLSLAYLAPLAPPPIKEGSIPWLLDKAQSGDLTKSDLLKALAEMGDPHAELDQFKHKARFSLIREAKQREWCTEADVWLDGLGLPGRPRPIPVRRQILVDVNVNVMADSVEEAATIQPTQNEIYQAFRNGQYISDTLKQVEPAPQQA